MGIDISKLSVTKARLLFSEKLKTYISIMEKYMTPEELEERKGKVTDEFSELIYDYFLIQREIPEAFTDGAKIDFTPREMKKMDRFSYVKKKLDSIVSDEIGYVNFITTNFETGDSGITYTSDDGKKHYEGINKSLTYSIINVVALLKEKNNEPFEYPKEMEPGDETTLFQVKDSISIDMMQVFGDDVIRHFFLGEGAKFNDELRHLFVLDSTVDKNASPDLVAFNALSNMQEFENGIDASIYHNDEAYFGKYSYMINKFKEMVKTIDLKQIDETEQKASKGLK